MYSAMLMLLHGFVSFVTCSTFNFLLVAWRAPATWRLQISANSPQVTDIDFVGSPEEPQAKPLSIYRRVPLVFITVRSFESAKRQKKIAIP